MDKLELHRENLRLKEKLANLEWEWSALWKLVNKV